jgi:hypothetical protein
VRYTSTSQATAWAHFGLKDGVAKDQKAPKRTGAGRSVTSIAKQKGGCKSTKICGQSPVLYGDILFRQYTNNNITVYNVYDPEIVHIKGHAPPYSTGLRPSTVLPTKHAALAIIITTGNTI